MLRFEIKTGSALTASETAAWSRLLRDGNPAPSPYLEPDYFQAVARARSSARVLIGRIGASEPVLYFPYHRAGLTGAVGLGHAIGGPISDVQGVIAQPGLAVAPETVMQAAGLALLPLSHVPATDPVFRPPSSRATGTDRHAFHVIDLADGFAAYEAARTPFAKSAFKGIRTRQAKAESQFGAVTHRFRDDDAASLEDLLAWKRQQFAATGQVNVLEVGWVRALIDDLRRRPAGLRVQISSLWFGDRRVAVHLGLRTATTLHYWFPAYDAAVQELSPGNLLLYRMAEEAARDGVRQIHLGAGEYRYKLEFANCAVPMRSMIATAPGLTGRMAASGRRAIEALGRSLPQRLAPIPSGVFRRLDRHLGFTAL